ncbi:MAG: hypothetical protein ACPGPE_09115 [Planctomycetota bacterium]
MDLDAFVPGPQVLCVVVGLVEFNASVQRRQTRSFSGSLDCAWGWCLLVLELLADAGTLPLFWAAAVGAWGSGSCCAGARSSSGAGVRRPVERRGTWAQGSIRPRSQRCSGAAAGPFSPDGTVPGLPTAWPPGPWRAEMIRIPVSRCCAARH